ncbi:hypothetical protein [Zeimonas arvi]|uniref:DUF2497 domain-containing protein n=1 Tax=Zeimonas arvi TaxID=2498847 RepID=A0A5C8P4E0_9BURK|nr:hypothetical protein [Zeimonas arvi]TXL68380.1 hypothetical protein FHP08_01445 [Zeimonas arvi]
MNDDEIRRLAERLRGPGGGAEAAGEPDEADDAIPMLTEVVAGPARGETAPALDAAAEDRIVERAIERLLGDPELLGGPLRDAIAAATERFAEQLAAELRATLVYALHDALAPAVREAVREAAQGGPGQPPL